MATVDEQLTQRNQQAQQNYNANVQKAQATSAQNLADTNALLNEQQSQEKKNWEKMKTWSAEGLAADNAASQQQLSDRMAYNDATHQQRVADTNAITQQRLDAARQQYDADTAGALAYRDQQNQQSAERRTAEDAAAREENAKKLAEYQAALNAANTGTQNFYNQQKAEYLAAMNDANARAQATYDQRNAEAQRLYNERSAESQGKINDMYDLYLAAQNQQYKAALDRGIAAQEEARAGVAKSYQTAANDLSVQAERNKRNQNMQAMANGLNTGTNSQQQLALNQAYMKNYGNLRGEEAAQNAGIDRAIANLKVDYENNIAQALADNNFQRAGALLEDYKSQVAWLDNQRMNNQNRLDTVMDANQNRFDTYNLNGLNYMYDQLARNQNRYDTQTLNAENRLNSQLDYNRQVTDTDRMNAESRYAQQMDTAANRRDTGLQNAQSYGDTMNLNELNRYDTTRANDQAAYDAQMQTNRDRADKKWYAGFETFQNSIDNYYNNQLAALQNSQNQNYDAQTRLLAQLYDAQQNNRNWAATQNRINVEQAREDAQRAEAYAREDKQYADKQALIKAETLAGFGDFSGYAALYGQGTADLMRQMWISQNPQMAWQAGLISDATYQKWLNGPAVAESGGGGGGYYGGGGSSNGTTFEAPSTGKANTQAVNHDTSAHWTTVNDRNTTKAASSGAAKAGGTTVNKNGFSGLSGKF